MHKTTDRHLSRRVLLGGIVAGAALLRRPVGLRAETSAASGPRAIAFDGSSLILAGNRFWRSTDGGSNWSAIAEANGAMVTAMATHPDRPGRIHAALETGGIMVSTDGSETWSPQGDGLPAAPITSMAAAASTPDTIYLSVRGDGIWRSQDAGAAWEFVMDRPYLAEAERDVMALASVDLASGMGGIWLYAGTEQGLTRVPDCFCRWQDVQAGDAMDALVSGETPAAEHPLPASEPVAALVSARSAPDTLYAAVTSGIWKSLDAGVVWQQVGTIGALALAVDPADPNHVVAVTSGGITFSRDGGTTWSAVAAIG